LRVYQGRSKYRTSSGDRPRLSPLTKGGCGKSMGQPINYGRIFYGQPPPIGTTIAKVGAVAALPPVTLRILFGDGFWL